jgi:hypothetical protein
VFCGVISKKRRAIITARNILKKQKGIIVSFTDLITFFLFFPLNEHLKIIIIFWAVN